ncbi:MAG: hypothetical protein ACR2N5_02060 [Solirubrobacterales bacterium]
MTSEERRGHLRSLLDDIATQRSVDEDDLRTELIHFVFELDDEVKALTDRIASLENAG